MSETDAGKKAERLERPRRIGGGTAEGTGRARQTDTARAEQTGDGLWYRWRQWYAVRM